MRVRRTDPAIRNVTFSKALQNRLGGLHAARKGTAHEGRIAGGNRMCGRLVTNVTTEATAGDVILMVKEI